MTVGKKRQMAIGSLTNGNREKIQQFREWKLGNHWQNTLKDIDAVERTEVDESAGSG